MSTTDTDHAAPGTAIAPPQGSHEPDHIEAAKSDAADSFEHGKRQAADQYGQAKAAVADGAAQLKGQAAEQYERLKDQGRVHANRISERVKNESAGYVNKRREGLAGEIGKFSLAARDAAERLDNEGDPTIATYAHKAADVMDEAKDYLANRDLSAIGRDVADLTRRRPEWVLGGLFIAGLAASRFFKASADRDRRDFDDDRVHAPYGTGYGQSVESRYGTAYRQEPGMTTGLTAGHGPDGTYAADRPAPTYGETAVDHDATVDAALASAYGTPAATTADLTGPGAMPADSDTLSSGTDARDAHDIDDLHTADATDVTVVGEVDSDDAIKSKEL
jgi:hypothetical protein